MKRVRWERIVLLQKTSTRDLNGRTHQHFLSANGSAFAESKRTASRGRKSYGGQAANTRE
jgi:hypothetical protein